ncbi:epoxide hydrolase [Herbiconiux sp. SALV-R1]|nr:epoxide hydrolase [Herbiconiux sp. SALV-R1]
MLEVTSGELAELRRRVRDTRWAPEWPPVEGRAGTDAALLRRLARYWADGFDWPAQEREIAALPAFEAVIDGTPVRFLKFDAERPGGLPLIATNGWPSTILEMVTLARLLSAPSRYGLDLTPRTVVVPAIPGLPFSPPRPRLGEQTHELWHRLMHEVLGFERYASHGGDLGAGITSRLAQAHPEAVAGIHLMAVAGPADPDPAGLTPDERDHLAAIALWEKEEGAYEHQQQTRPLSLAPALSDSPVGLLAWIVEKYDAWSDDDGDVSTRFSDDALLTQASAYWFTNSASTSLRPYYEFAHGQTTPIRSVTVPTAVAVFPHDLVQPPREWAERSYRVVRYTRFPRGGHFAPHEEPELLAADIATFLDELER